MGERVRRSLNADRSPPKAKLDYKVEPPSGTLLADTDGDEAVVDLEPWNVEPERREATVMRDLHGQRLDKAVVAMASEFSRGHLQALIEGGHVSIDGRASTTASRRVGAGQRIVVMLMPTAQSKAFRPEPMALVIVHEDADLFVVDKPAGMVVHPAAGNWTGTLLNGLLARHPAAATLPRAGIVHRLDKDTSGLLVVGKTLPAVTALSRAIAAREVRRCYVAIVHGEVVETAFTIEAPIGRDPRSRVRMAVVPGGKPARTDVSCIARGGGFSVLQCQLHTGRTHQIRVHLASRGHALVADATYGGSAALGMSRQALHASHLAFVHPRLASPVAFDAEAPADIAAACRAVVGA